MKTMITANILSIQGDWHNAVKQIERMNSALTKQNFKINEVRTGHWLIIKNEQKFGENNKVIGSEETRYNFRFHTVAVLNEDHIPFNDVIVDPKLTIPQTEKGFYILEGSTIVKEYLELFKERKILKGHFRISPEARFLGEPLLTFDRP